MSDTPKSDDQPGDEDTAKRWVPSPEQPVPPTTTEFKAVAAEPGPTAPADGPGDEPASVPVTAPASAPQPVPASTTVPGARTPASSPPAPGAPTAGATPPVAEPTIAAAVGGAASATGGVPPVTGPAPAYTSGPQPPNQAGTLGGMIPEDRPELLLAAALAGGVLAAIVLRTLVRR